VLVSDFNYDLPEELIAQHPPAQRGTSRMLVMDRRTGALTDAMFRDLPQLLQPGDLLVLNDSRVLPARLYATRGSGATRAATRAPADPSQPSGLIEVLLTEEIDGPTYPSGSLWRCLVKPARKVRPGETLLFFETSQEGDAQTRSPEPVLTAEVLASGAFGERTLRFASVDDFQATLARIGHMPLPPYIRRKQAQQPDTAEDRERYQTVYSHQPGSAAAPTAGLHFTPEILAALKVRGVEIAYLTLHVGLGTFQPVRVSSLADIHLHAERYMLPKATADALNRALAEGHRIIAAGTTTTRVLEHIAEQGHISPHSGSTSIFLAPGHRFRIQGGLLTNFHLPESTLLMLVAAFASDTDNTDRTTDNGPDRGRQTILAAYAHAIHQQYRFYSYGDCMLLL